MAITFPPLRSLRASLYAVFATMALTSASWGASRETPKFAGNDFPVPPAQSLPWSPPRSSLPPEAVTAIEQLYRAGLADPRGCDYRSIEIVVGDCWGNSTIIKTHGWVLPSHDGQKFAICWNGLIYPLISLGSAADLSADVATMIKTDDEVIAKDRTRSDQSEKQRAEEAKRLGKEYRHIDWPLRRDRYAEREARTVACDVLHPINAALLYRAGKAKLAHQVWSQWYGAIPRSKEDDIYLRLANDWLWALYDRAVNAHARGDDHLASASARDLLPLWKSVEPDVTKAKTEDFAFMQSFPALLTDQKRRAKEPAYTPLLQIPHQPQGPERVAGLIRDLELVSARQWSQPGGVNLAEDPIVQALIKTGPDAVEPLLDCLENDTRLTRSVRFGRDFFRSRTILGVHEAAYAVLANILQTNFFSSGSTGDSLTARGQEGRKAVADRIRAYWKKYQAVPLEERWFQTLNDDHAAPAQWLEAAANIVRPADVEVERSSMFGEWTTIPNRQPGEIPPLRGEALRAKTNPSVSDLLIKRMADPALAWPNPSYSLLANKKQFALALAKWDGPAHLDVLRACTEELKADLDAPNKSRDSAAAAVLGLFNVRLQCGDPEVLGDYAAWIASLPRKDLGFSTSKIFEIMWHHPDDPAIQAAAVKLFQSPDSPWVPLSGKESGSYYCLELINSPLAGIPAFRTELLRGLADRSVAGTVSCSAPGQLSVHGNGGWSSGGGGDFGLEDPLAPSPGSIVPFRACDLYADRISRIHGAPKFRLYWPEEKKNTVITATVEFLRRYGDLLKYQPGDTDEFGSTNTARIHFDKLDHPATSEDVRQGRAIFSLGGESRLWKMPAFPMDASWITLKDNPALATSFSEGKTKSITIYQTKGTVFQAEEVLVDGEWKRFFGFVGPYHISKVPGSEIEFPARYPFFPLTHGFDCAFKGPGRVLAGLDRSISQITSAQPLPVTLRIRNRSGLDQPVPGSLLLPPGTARQLPHSVGLVLSYTNQILPNPEAIGESEWKPIPLKKEIQVAPSQPPGRVLAPAEEFTLQQIDLQDYFDVSRPGAYRIQASFDDAKGSAGKTDHAFFAISKD